MENVVKLHFAFFSDPFSISLTSLSSACTPCYALFSHHAHQTPSLSPIIRNLVALQIQVLQGGVRFEAFGQGLTGESWTSSPALELLKHCPLSLPVLLENFAS